MDLILEPVRSTRYEMDFRNQPDGTAVVTIKDRIAPFRKASVEGEEALPTYKALKRYKGSGNTDTFNLRCSEIIKTKNLCDAVLEDEQPEEISSADIIAARKNGVESAQYKDHLFGERVKPKKIKEPEEEKDVYVPKPPAELLPAKLEVQPKLTVRIYVGDTVISSSEDKDLWKMVMNSMI